MFNPSELLRRLYYLLNRRKLARLLEQEMLAHREALGDTARFGNVPRLREEADDVWGWRPLDDLARDIRFAARQLTRAPVFTGSVVLLLAIGLALVAVTLAIVNAYLLRPLPYGAGDRLHHVRYAPPGPWEPAGLAALDWRSVADVVEFPITASGDTYYLGDGAYAQTTRALLVAPGFIDGLGVRAVAGRTLVASDWGATSDDVAMIGHALWRNQYASDPSIVGRTIRVEAESASGASETLRVVGVLAPDFYFGRDSRATVDLLRPLRTSARTYLVRLQPGVPVALAEQRLTAVARMVATDLPPDWTGVELESVRERYVGDLRPILVGSTVVSGLILALVCVNVAILTLLRTLRRDREMAVRVALGAGRWRLLRMLMLEAILLTGAALSAGVTMAWIALGSFAPAIETHLGRPAPGGTTALGIDSTLLALVAVAGVIATIALTVVPALLPWQRRLANALGSTRGTSSGPGPGRLRRALLVLQVAGTLVLLVSGALALQGTLRMIRTDLGFDTSHLLRGRITLRAASHEGPADFARFYDTFAGTASSRLGTRLVFSTWPPFADLPTVRVDTNSADAAAGAVAVGPEYFATLGTRLLEGRDVSMADVLDDAPVAVVSDTLARRLWRDGAVIGRQLRVVDVTPAGTTPGPWRTVVGVAADVRQSYFDIAVADVYTPLTAQRDRHGSFYVRTSRTPADAWSVLRSVAAEIDGTAVVSDPIVAAAENAELEGAAFLAFALGIVATAAVLLAGFGIYAVTAFAVDQRARETALRMALGATPGAIGGRFLRELALVVALGLGGGLVSTLLLARLASSRLAGFSGLDAGAVMAALAAVVAVSTVAALRPLRRAAFTSPASVLKED